MDPRHPELAINRVKELSEQFDRVLDDIRNETISNKLGGLEREGSLVVQELCLVAPRLHEAMMQVSRQRRNELSRGIAFGYIPEEKVGKYTKATIGIEEKSAEKRRSETLAEIAKQTENISEQVSEIVDIVTEEVKETAKKKTAKKKTTKKAKK